MKNIIEMLPVIIFVIIGIILALLCLFLTARDLIIK